VVHLENPAAVNKRPDADQMGMRSEPGLTDDSASAWRESSRLTVRKPDRQETRRYKEHHPKEHHSLEHNRDTDRFDEFWQAYPKKVAKPKARQLWLKVIKKHNRQMLIDAARSYADDPKRDPDFTLNPTTWLSQERWTDEPPQAAKPSGPVTILNMYADEPCEHGDPMGESRCALCRRK
jgi:hypothetical protein